MNDRSSSSQAIKGWRGAHWGREASILPDAEQRLHGPRPARKRTLTHFSDTATGVRDRPHITVRDDARQPLDREDRGLQWFGSRRLVLHLTAAGRLLDGLRPATAGAGFAADRQSCRQGLVNALCDGRESCRGDTQQSQPDSHRLADRAPQDRRTRSHAGIVGGRQPESRVTSPVHAGPAIFSIWRTVGRTPLMTTAWRANSTRSPRP